MSDYIDTPGSSHGEGISRPVKGARTRLYMLKVTGPNFPSMRIQMRAETFPRALRYARARWPQCTIEKIK